MKLGVLGGTFDPIHLGHLALAEEARRCAGLDQVLLVPAAEPPHRPRPTASAADRLEMCRLAASGRPWLDVSDIELRRPGPSYTLDTLRALRRERPQDELYLILGWDAARELGHWKGPDEVMELARVVVVDRPGLRGPTRADLELAGIDPDRALLCHARTPAVEASEVRRLLEEGGPLDSLVDPAVEAYLRSRGLYRRPGHNSSR